LTFIKVEVSLLLLKQQRSFLSDQRLNYPDELCQGRSIRQNGRPSVDHGALWSGTAAAMGGRGNWTYQRDRQTSERLAERDRIASS
jgi:hypothetical protein